MNPFTPTKFELEQNPVIWLSKFSKKMKGDMKSNFVSGSRGSGKTTILRSLATETILSDRFLREQHGKAKLRWYGQYLKFNRNFQEYTDSLEASLCGRFADEQLSERLFGAYLEISLLKFMLDDAVRLQADGKIHFHGSSEVNACSQLAFLFSDFDWIKIPQLFDFHDALRLVTRIRKKFLEFRTDRDVEPLVQIIDRFEPCSVLSFIREFVLPSIRTSDVANSAEINLYVLLDDCENLSNSQQIALNSLIKRTEGEVKWVLCFLSERYNITDTNLRNTTLTTDDREVLPLNEIDEKEFVSFCEKVTNTRIEKFLEVLKSSHFSNRHTDFRITQKFQSDVSYNSRIARLVDQSTARSVVSFVADVESTRDRLLNFTSKKNRPRFNLGKGSPLPFVQHAVIEAFGLKVEDYVSDSGQVSLYNTLRGKQAFAYIAICSKYFPAPIYGGSEYVVAVSDRCIRDYLDVMGAFYDHFASSEDGNFSRSKAISAALRFWSESAVDVGLQDRILKRASLKKIENLKLSKQSRSTLENFVFAFGELQAAIEGDYLEWGSIRQSRRGLFEVEVEEVAKRSSMSTQDVLSVFHELEYDRYIKIHPDPEDKARSGVKFSLHRRLRPYFSCGHLSVSGDPITISAHLLADILSNEDDFDAKDWAGRAYADIRPAPDDRQMELEL